MIIIHEPRRAGVGPDGDAFDKRILEPHAPIPKSAVWIDLVEPTREEDQLVEEHLGISIPTREEMQDIEPSSLLYAENGARYMTARIICSSDTAAPKLTAVSFILTDRALVTVRYDEPRSFQLFSNRIGKPGVCGRQPEAVLDGLIEAIIDRAAEVLRRVGDDIEQASRAVFERNASDTERTGAFQTVIRQLGRHGDLISNVRESMVSLERMLLYLSANMKRPRRSTGFQAEWRTAVRDVQSIEEHANFLSNKIQFILDAVLGLVSIEQGRVIKLFSVVAVMFLPPTLVASSYGMNFKKMPELEWTYGYPMAIFMMILAGVIPYLFFKWKKWL